MTVPGDDEDVMVEDVAWVFHPDRDRWATVGVTVWQDVQALTYVGVSWKHGQVSTPPGRVLVSDVFDQHLRTVLSRFVAERDEWARHRFDASETVGWLLTAVAARKSLSYDLEVSDAVPWRDHRFRACDAAGWIVGTSPTDRWAFTWQHAVRWRDLGFTAQQARHVVTRYGWVSPHRVDVATCRPRRWRRIGKLWRTPTRFIHSTAAFAHR